VTFANRRVQHSWWLWDKQPNISAGDVNAVLNQFDSNWDMSFTGLKEPTGTA
jgi:hypothetical protein